MDLAKSPQEEYTWELPDLVDKTTRRAEVNTVEHFDEDEHLKLEKRVTEVSSYALAVFCVYADIAIQTVLLSVYTVIYPSKQQSVFMILFPYPVRAQKYVYHSMKEVESPSTCFKGMSTDR